jgi:hypothetical protein
LHLHTYVHIICTIFILLPPFPITPLQLMQTPPSTHTAWPVLLFCSLIL